MTTRRKEKKKEEKGFTIVVLRLFINAKGIAKVAVGLAKGKKQHDKRATIKERDITRRLEKEGKW